MGLRDKLPWAVPATSTAVSELPSTSVSLPRTPGAATLSGASSPVLYALLTATGASFTAATVIETVALFELNWPSLAR